MFQFLLVIINSANNYSSKLHGVPSFNSSLVQLNFMRHIALSTQEMFQFLLGTINKSVAVGVTSPVPSFQFLLGTINSINWSQSEAHVYKFQFLLGTINRQGYSIQQIQSYLFQFLLGTINRFKRFKRYSLLFCFNSSLVQLIAVSGKQYRKGNACFNSSLVQLIESRMKSSKQLKQVSIPPWYN